MTRGISPDFAVEELFSPPLENLEQGLSPPDRSHTVFLLIWRSMVLPHIVLTLQQRQRTVEVRTRTWRNNDPFDETTLSERVRWQLRAWLDSARLKSGPGIRGGVVRLRIAPQKYRTGKTACAPRGRPLSGGGASCAHPDPGPRRDRRCSHGKATGRTRAGRADGLVPLGRRASPVTPRPRCSMAGTCPCTYPGPGATRSSHPRGGVG